MVRSELATIVLMFVVWMASHMITFVRRNCANKACCISNCNSYCDARATPKLSTSCTYCKDTTAYECECNSGYIGNGTLCSDVNECDNSTSNNCTGADRVCINTEGSYHCSCAAGLTGNFTNCTEHWNILSAHIFAHILPASLFPKLAVE